MAENSVIEVSIVTPDGKVYEENAKMLVVTTKVGQLGIMGDHVPLIANLDVDQARVERDGNTDIVAVNGGFIEFADNHATIVADSAENQSDIDVARAENAKSRAEKHIQEAKAKNDTDSLARAQVALRKAINRINTSKI
ncbi:F0F1 ATP synthase subunit epsilon [Lentilactobacillus senioris]|uniref:F0F1 ATP synthase subunit epsilon n=1 Tax=Lentilactobacillus senioris TaxID=931534 RepID=UPI002280B3EB|nr:F0F1 ATP synthase subunit epsilon [Lentilactobacillus senioris]MCY9807269.1 F0F1 ATP synthase subunit epsilon [Lentilactobacillus senioris]